jgi:hypothetical protein
LDECPDRAPHRTCEVRDRAVDRDDSDRD